MSIRFVVPAYVVGVGVQIALLALLWASVGMGSVGWLVGTAYAVVTWAILTSALRRSRSQSFGPANQITLARAALVGSVTALVADYIVDGVPVVAVVTLAALALVLDGVDGQVARRTETASPMGARFDMEIDAFLILVLSISVTAS